MDQDKREIFDNSVWVLWWEHEEPAGAFCNFRDVKMKIYDMAFINCADILGPPLPDYPDENEYTLCTEAGNIKIKRFCTRR